MKKQLLPCALGAFLFISLFSCTKTDSVAELGISPDIKAKIENLGFSSDEAVATKDGYIVEGDIFLSHQQLNEGFTAASPNLLIANEEHYRTTNLVTGLPRVITVSVTSTAAQYFHDAADAAIARYNAENLQLTFQKVTGTADINIVIFYEVSNTLGSAGFPTAGGDPYNEIRMNSYWYSASTNLNYLTSIMAHEMGHCIGMRHTDYMNRRYSCGPGGINNEGASTVGAIHIPGTPTKADPNSWMLACIGSGVNRPFTANDKIALNYLY